LLLFTALHNGSAMAPRDFVVVPCSFEVVCAVNYETGTEGEEANPTRTFIEKRISFTQYSA